MLKTSSHKIESNPSVKKAWFIQPKLKVGKPNNRYEQEADRMADHVIRRKPSATPIIQKMADVEEEELQLKCAECGQEEQLQRMASDGEEDELVQAKGKNVQNTPNIEGLLSASKGGGQPMEEGIRSEMEAGFGADFGNVRIHENNNAVQMSQSLNAQAFTNGNDIYFNSGKYDASSSQGKHLLAHELTHTIQQKGIQNLQMQVNGTNPKFGHTPLFQNKSCTTSFIQPKRNVGKRRTDSQPAHAELSNSQISIQDDPEFQELFHHSCATTPSSQDPTTWRKEFGAHDARIVTLAKQYALRRCNRALLNLGSGSRYPESLARIIFGQDVSISQMRDTIQSIRANVRSANIVAGTCQDPSCHPMNRVPPLAFIDHRNNDMVICPQSFRSGFEPYNMLDTIIHEAGHLTGMDSHIRPADEVYCTSNNCSEACRENENTAQNVDAWAKLILCLI